MNRLFSAWFGPGVEDASLDQRSQPEAARELICAVFRDLGVNADPEEEEIDYICWRRSHGSAHLLIMLYPDHQRAAGDWVVQVSAVMVTLPEPSPLALFEFCLQQNMTLVDCYFALHHEADVVLTSKRRAAGLDAVAFRAMLTSVSQQADRLDNLLAERFGARMWGRDP